VNVRLTPRFQVAAGMLVSDRIPPNSRSTRACPLGQVAFLLAYPFRKLHEISDIQLIHPADHLLWQ